MSIADNLHRVRERIARAAERAGRSADEITLVGVTKYVGAQEAAQLADAGCFDLGESRPQELWKKVEALQDSVQTIRWHFIGHLQRNKVARTLPFVSLIHSVDSERLLAAINDTRAAAADKPPPIPVLLEVNTSGEAAKNGLPPNEVEPLLAAATRYPHVAIRGLMTMAAFEGDESIAAQNFASLRKLRDCLKPNTPGCVSLNELSMGMSGDFEIAIQEGTTIVRVGSRYFASDFPAIGEVVMPWSNGEKFNDYDEDKVLDAYIASNLTYLASESESTGYYLAQKIERARGDDEYSKMYQAILAQQPTEVAKAVALGSTTIYEQIKNWIRTGKISVNRCPKCNRIVRRPLAKQCLWCGHDWHDIAEQ